MGERERERDTPSLPAWWYYLDEVLHIAVKQPMVIHGAGSRLPHFLWFRGEGGGPGKRWTKGRDIITLGTEKNQSSRGKTSIDVRRKGQFQWEGFGGDAWRWSLS